MYINNRFHSNVGRLDISNSKFAVAYTERFNQDFVKFFNSLREAYKFMFRVERPRFYYRDSVDFNYWSSAYICNCHNKLVVYSDDKPFSIFS